MFPPASRIRSNNFKRRFSFSSAPLPGGRPSSLISAARFSPELSAPMSFKKSTTETRQFRPLPSARLSRAFSSSAAVMPSPFRMSMILSQISLNITHLLTPYYTFFRVELQASPPPRAQPDEQHR